MIEKPKVRFTLNPAIDGEGLIVGYQIIDNLSGLILGYVNSVEAAKRLLKARMKSIQLDDAGDPIEVVE